jgi:hypothetical protein
VRERGGANKGFEEVRGLACVQITDGGGTPREQNLRAFELAVRGEKGEGKNRAHVATDGGAGMRGGWNL